LNTSMRSATPWHSTTRRFSTKKPCSHVLKSLCPSTFTVDDHCREYF
jgi:hypothetical protein